MEGSNPSSSDLPSYQGRRQQSAAHRVPPDPPLSPLPAFPPSSASSFQDPNAEAVPTVPLEDSSPADPQPDAGSPEPSDFARAAETGHGDTIIAAAPAPQYPLEGEPAAPAMNSEPPRDNLPGDASAPPTTTPKAVIYRPAPPQSPAPTTLPGAPVPPARPARIPGPRSRFFTFLALVWLAAWTGMMTLVLNHPFDRESDWDTSMWSIAARNLVREGFTTLRGGVYVTAGEGFAPAQREFYAGQPPMTAWILAGWMKALHVTDAGSADKLIRGLPLAFTALNLLLLFLLAKRVFGSGVGLAAMIACSILPMTAFYAQNIGAEQFTVTFLLLAAHGYLSWCRCRSRFGLLLLFVSVILGCWTSWPMYAFAGFLAIAHFVQRRTPLAAPVAPANAGDAADADAGPVLPGRPVIFSLCLLIFALGMFAAFIFYLKIQPHPEGRSYSFDDTLQRAREHWSAPAAPLAPATQPATGAAASAQPAPPAAAAERIPAMKLIMDRLRDTSEQNQRITFANLRYHFLSVFTIPGLVLAFIGALFWRRWSRRLARDDDSVMRRAAFRVILCLVLMQLAYSLAFPRGAWRFEFWQYYLIVPAALMIGGFCAWLTVAGVEPRRFITGLFDRTAWAAFVLIAVWGITPLAWRLQVPLPARPVARAENNLNLDLVEPLKKLTSPQDVILALDGMQFALPWYADRFFAAGAPGEVVRDRKDAEQKVTALVKEYVPAQAQGAPPRWRIFLLVSDRSPKPLADYVASLYTKVQKIGDDTLYVRPEGAAPATGPATRPAK